MAYADYEYYTGTFRNGYKGGSFIEQDAFPYLANLASLYVKSATKGLADSVKGDALEAATGVNSADVEYMDKRKRELLELYLGALPEFAGLFRAKSFRCIHDARGCGR